MFTVYKRFARQVPVYRLKDDLDEILDGIFYKSELRKIPTPVPCFQPFGKAVFNERHPEMLIPTRLLSKVNQQLSLPGCSSFLRLV